MRASLHSYQISMHGTVHVKHKNRKKERQLELLSTRMGSLVEQGQQTHLRLDDAGPRPTTHLPTLIHPNQSPLRDNKTNRIKHQLNRQSKRLRRHNNPRTASIIQTNHEETTTTNASYSSKPRERQHATLSRTRRRIDGPPDHRRLGSPLHLALAAR
jgi:hypothetical protein